MSLILTLLTLGVRVSLGQIVQVDAELASALEETPKSSAVGTPVVMMHGMGDFANNPMGMVPLRKLIAKNANAYVHSVELCSDPKKFSDCMSEDSVNGFLMPMDEQVEQFARVVRADAQLAGGFNAIGFSQGNTLIRGYIHYYNNPPVKAFVSVHGPMMGVSGLPRCPMDLAICRSMNWLIEHSGVYSKLVQNHLAQANYYRDSRDLNTYRKYCRFLPFINNEVTGRENATYIDNFKSLEKLVLVMANNDTMVIPKESEHFGYFKDGSDEEQIAMKDAPWYTEDWFGLRSLDEANKLDFFSTPGNHLGFTVGFISKIVKQYFVSNSINDVIV